MYFVAWIPDPAPASPNLAEVVEVLLTVDDHVEGISILMGARPGGCDWIAGFTTDEAAVEALLLTVRAQSRCNPRRDPGPSRQQN